MKERKANSPQQITHKATVPHSEQKSKRPRTGEKLLHDSNYTMATANGQTTHTIHPKKGDNPLETLAPLAHRKINATKHGAYEQRVSYDTVTNPTPNPNPGSPQNGHATWRDIITN